MKLIDVNHLFEAQQELFEVEMSPSNLKRLASQIPDARVGIEFEMVVPNVQSEDIETVADEFSDAIGKRVYSSTSYHGARRSEDAYSLEPDSSIDAEPGEAGLEFISPPMSVEDMLEDLESVREWAIARGCYTNKSTGLHINVSVPNYSLDNLDYVKLAILLGDKYVLEKFNRYGSGWAKSALDIVQERAKDPETVAKLLDQVKGGVESIASKILHSGRTDKYTSINTKDGYVEFRSAGGDWLGKNYDKIKDTLLRFVVALDAACDKEKYKKEYLKGLYKVLQPKDPSSDMSMFAKYMAGQITLSQYIRNLEQVRKERFKGQGIGIIYPEQAEEGDWEITYDDGMKNETIYIAKTDKVANEQSALDAARKFKPHWFRAGNEQYVTIKPFKFGEELDNLKLYRADYAHKYMGVVAKDEEQAKEFVRVMDADYFTHYPETQIDLVDENETSKRKIKGIYDWQQDKLRNGREWLARKKIWRATGRSRIAGRYYIAAITRDDAIEIAKKLDPEMANSENFEVYISDAFVNENDYEAYQRAQNDMIQQREAEEERVRADQEAQDSDIDISNLKTYRVSNMNGYKYVVAENGAEAAELATQLEPDKFPNVQDLTVQDQSGLASTSNPALIKGMYHSQQQTLNSRRDVSRGQSIQGTMGTPQPAFGQSSHARISDLRRFMVTNNDDPNSGSVSIAATSADDAIARARQAQPAWATAGLYARPL